MIKTDNLYAEVVINESPFHYDDHGRLRVRVLEEEIMMRTADFQDRNRNGKDDRDEMPEKKPGAIPEIPNQKPPAIRPGTGQPIRGGIGQRIRGGVARRLVPMPSAGAIPAESTPPPGMELNPDYKDRFSGGQIGTMDMRPSDEKYRPKKPMAPVEKTDMPQPPLRSGVPAKQKPGLGNIIGGIKRPGIGGIARPMPAVPPSGKMTTDQGFAPGEGQGRVVARPAVGVKRPGKPLRSFRFSSQSRAGAGRNVNTRAGLRSVRPAQRNMMEDSRSATDYIEEKMNLKTSEMGDVIKDFQKSDAPQFKGKSKEKRRIMAIAAKLQAERGE